MYVCVSTFPVQRVHFHLCRQQGLLLVVQLLGGRHLEKLEFIVKILINNIITSSSLVLSSSTSNCVDFFISSATSSSALFDLT